jgi:DNA adenine methylase
MAKTPAILRKPTSPRYASPLRYPGGKARMAPWLTDVFDTLQWPMDVEIWLEPFGGGAGAALTALMSGRVPEAWIVEANPALAAFWTTVMGDGPALARRIENTTPTLELFQRAQQSVADALAGNPVDPFELGFAAFMLNRCSRSGMVIPNVGPIGGKTQAGLHTIDARFNAPALADRVRAVHSLGDRFKVFAGDGIAFLEDLPESGIEDEVFCFVDPPYIGVGNDLYAIGMDDALHRRLAEALNRLASPWLLTYDAHPQVPLLYPDRPVVQFDIPHTVGSSRIGSEYLVLGPGMALPDANPLGKGNIELLAA